MLQGVTVDEQRVNDIKKLADKLISQGRTDVDFVQGKRDTLVNKYVVLFLRYFIVSFLGFICCFKS